MKRTVRGFAAAGAAGVLIEDQVHVLGMCRLHQSLPYGEEWDQVARSRFHAVLCVMVVTLIGRAFNVKVWPKSCGHVRGKRVVSHEEAVARVRAAVDAR